MDGGGEGHLLHQNIIPVRSRRPRGPIGRGAAPSWATTLARDVRGPAPTLPAPRRQRPCPKLSRRSVRHLFTKTLSLSRLPALRYVSVEPMGEGGPSIPHCGGRDLRVPGTVFAPTLNARSVAAAYASQSPPSPTQETSTGSPTRSRRWSP